MGPPLSYGDFWAASVSVGHLTCSRFPVYTGWMLWCCVRCILQCKGAVSPLGRIRPEDLRSLPFSSEAPPREVLVCLAAIGREVQAIRHLCRLSNTPWYLGRSCRFLINQCCSGRYSICERLGDAGYNGMI